MYSDTDGHRQEIVNQAQELGCVAGVAAHEYRAGYVLICAAKGRCARVGTANETWDAAVYLSQSAAEIGEAPWSSISVPSSHRHAAEGIARYIVGVLAGISEYRAYPSGRKRRTADKAERERDRRHS